MQDPIRAYELCIAGPRRDENLVFAGLHVADIERGIGRGAEQKVSAVREEGGVIVRALRFPRTGHRKALAPFLVGPVDEVPMLKQNDTG